MANTTNENTNYVTQEQLNSAVEAAVVRGIAVAMQQGMTAPTTQPATQANTDAKDKEIAEMKEMIGQLMANQAVTANPPVVVQTPAVENKEPAKEWSTAKKVGVGAAVALLGIAWSKACFQAGNQYSTNCQLLSSNNNGNGFDNNGFGTNGNGGLGTL